MKKYRKYVLCLLVIAVMIVIFKLSSQPAVESKKLSDQFVVTYKELVEPIPFMPSSMKTVLIARASHYVRKSAHLMIYAVLGAVMLLMLREVKFSGKKYFWWAVFFCMLYAITDEWHQYYVSGRGAQLKDVIIDTTGAFMGAGMMQVIMVTIKSIGNLIEI